VTRVLGTGGMATVFEVFDTATERRLALKRLHALPDAARRQRTIELFEREFHALSHLAHPRVVEAYDYGLDESGPYYTMEMLDGGELSQLAPLPWRRACEIARDVCSALSLVHSRRWVYRDLNPRNVHCTSDGRAKLIDFGALCPLGPAKQVVGTPAYCAPEVLDFAPLDGRTDLYSLGATLYFMLTGRHAYPARSFEQLRLALETRPARPSELVPEVPVALDNLVMDLLHPEPSVRPANAAEVLEQLAAIEGRTLEEQTQVTLAYLSTPSLVSRDTALARTRTKITRAQRSRGGVLLFEGASGAGRSRMLAACRLEAKLQGLLTVTVQADAGDAHDDYGALRALSAQLLLAAPELSVQLAEPLLPVLGHVLPELLALRPDTQLEPFSDGTRLRPLALAAARDWLLALSAQRPLLIAVDDLHAIDEPSAAVIALLARGLENHGLLLIASVETGAIAIAPAPLKVFSAAATSTLLENLNLEDSEHLLRSVFGDVPHVQLLAHRLHHITHGNPRDLTQLAQYLVDRGLAQFRAGAWSLPNQIDEADLPNDMAQALADRVRALGPLARTLGLALTLTPDRGLSLAECVAACEGESPASVFAALDELQRVQAITAAADNHAISQRGFAIALQAGADADQKRQLHARLSRVFERRGHEEFRRAQHLMHAGQVDLGLDVLVAFALESKIRTDSDTRAFGSLIAALPEDWLPFYLDAVEQCVQRGRAARDAHALRLRFVSFGNVMGVPVALAAPLLRACMEDLARASGLDQCVAQPDAADPTLAARLAIGAAQQRYDTCPANEQICPPMLAVRDLSRALISTAGLATLTLDYELALAMPSLAGFRALSPALEVVERLRCGSLVRMSGRFEEACAAYRDLLTYSDRADYAGLDVSNHRLMRAGVMGALGLMEASCNLDASPAWAAQAESEPLYLVQASQIRMVHALWEGRVHDADKHSAHFELLRIQGGPRQLGDGAYLLARVTANAAGDDLTRIKQTAEDIQAMAARHAPWRAVSEYALGEYERIRGDKLRALAHLDAALSLCGADTNPIWAYAAGARVQVLREQGQLEEARTAGEAYLADAEQNALVWHTNFIRLPLALTLSELGDTTHAVQLADFVIAQFQHAGSRGLPNVLAYEARTRIALAANDLPGYESALAQLAEHARSSQGRGLRVKYERLKADTRTHANQTDATGATGVTLLTGTQMRSVLAGCNVPHERAQRTLQLLLRRSGAEEGSLYWHREGGRELVATIGDGTADPGLAHFLDDFVQSQLQDKDMNTCSQETDVADTGMTSNLWMAEDGAQHHTVLLSHQTPQGFAITGVAILRATQVKFTHPTALASSLSRALLDAGDVVPLLVLN
jgi:Protein kinase domain/AAA ATPase domain